MNKLKQSINNGELTLGSWLQLPDVFSAEIMAKSGFDWLAIDMEHGLIDIASAFRLIQVIGLTGVAPLVRLNTNDPSTIRRVMDAGAQGVIVPMVNSAHDAQLAADAVYYAPKGDRSFGLGRAHEFGNKFEEYIEVANADSVLVVQIEHIDAVSNLDAILKVQGIDAIIIGPYDLSGSMGIPGKFNDSKFQDEINSIVEKVKKYKIALGIHIVRPSTVDYETRIKQGFRFIGFGIDTIYLSENSAMAVKQCRERQK